MLIALFGGRLSRCLSTRHGHAIKVEDDYSEKKERPSLNLHPFLQAENVRRGDHRNSPLQGQSDLGSFVCKFAWAGTSDTGKEILAGFPRYWGQGDFCAHQEVAQGSPTAVCKRRP